MLISTSRRVLADAFSDLISDIADPTAKRAIKPENPSHIFCLMFMVWDSFGDYRIARIACNQGKRKRNPLEMSHDRNIAVTKA